MPSKLTRPALLLLACAIVLPASGCARNKSSADTAYIARDVNSLYALAKQRMDRGLYEDAAKLFERGYRGTHAGHSQGGGIGLSIVRRLCELYGWNVQVAPGEVQGVVATLRFEHAA